MTKRKTGARHKSGKLVQPVPEERDFTVVKTVMLRRCKENGLRPTDENLKTVRDSRYGFELGKARVKGHITQDEFEAGVAYALAYNAHRTIQGWPSRMPKAASYGLSVAGVDNREPDPNHVRNVRAAWKAYTDALGTAGSGPAHIVNRVTIEDEKPYSMDWLKAGLKAIIRVG